MTISEILSQSNKKLNPAAKLKQIKQVVKSARKVYGNKHITIPTQSTNSCNGITPIEYLTDKDKLALISTVTASIRIQAIEATQATEGTLFEQEVIKLIATNSILCNIGNSVTSEFI